MLSVLQGRLSQGNAAKCRNKFPEPPIPLIQPKQECAKKDEMTKLELKSKPEDDKSVAMHSVSICHHGHGTPAQWLHFQKDFKRILKGQNIKESGDTHRMMQNLPRGDDALHVFNNKASELGNETDEHFKLSLNTLTAHIFLLPALVKQKCYMQRHMRKLREMTTREHGTQIVKMSEELVMCPNFLAGDKFDDDELMDVHENKVAE